MKKQLFDLTIEEFTSVLLDFQEKIHLSINVYDSDDARDKNKEVDILVGTYNELNNFSEDFAPNHPARMAIKEELKNHFDYDIQINQLDIYNYLEHITFNFQEERVEITFNEMDCFYLMTYLETIDQEVQEQYIKNEWDFPTREFSLKNKEGLIIARDTVYDFVAMREKIYPCRDFIYISATSLLRRKMPSQQTKEQRKYTISKGHKTDFVKLVSAMYDCHLFETTDGKTASNKEDLLNSLGEFFSENLTASSTLLNEAKKKNNYLDIFDKIKEKGEKYYKKGL